MLTTASKASRPIPINTANLGSNVANASTNPYPSPVSPTTLSFSPSKFLSTYQLPVAFTSRYKLLEELGFGGFGFVYSVFRLSDGARFACKFIFKSKVSRTSWTIDRVLGKCPMEVAVLKNVRHENIIEFVDYFDDAALCYCFTKMHGTEWSTNDTTPKSPDSRRSMDLFECIEKFESFAEPLARHIFVQIVRAIAHLHEIGLVHRDIKDENILIDDNFHVKVIDFGSAAFFDPTGKKLFDLFLGTKQYASPEILQQKQYRGPEAEMWALGCCLYIILTGLVPFSSAAQAIRGRFASPNRPLSPSCTDLLERMLEKDPKLRISIQELVVHPWVVNLHCE